MIKLPLEKRKDQRGNPHILPWASCLPFVENSRGILIHRPRSAATYTMHKKPHIVISFWCGMHVSGGKNFTFLPKPPECRIVCQRCEELAVAAGLPSADALAGKHVHKGGVKAYRSCCAGEQED